MFKAFWKLFLIFILIISITSCNNKNDTKIEESPYEINWYIVANSQPKDTTLIEDEINKITLPKINCTVKIHVINWLDWVTKMNVSFATSQYLDIVFTSSWWHYIDNISKEAFLPLDNLVEENCPNVKEIFDESEIDTCRYNNKLYGLPVKKENYTAKGLIFNKKYIDKYNFDINKINKLEDIEPWLKIIKENEDIIPLGLSPSDNFFTYNLPLISVSGSYSVPGSMYLDNRDNKIYNEIETTEYREIIELTRKFYLSGYISKEANIKDFDFDYKNLITSGNCFCLPAPLKPGKDKEISNENVVWIQKEIGPNYYTGLSGSMQAISKTSKNPEKCLQFLNLLYEDKKLVNLLAWGIENKHYKKISDNVIKEIPNNNWNLNMQWMFGNQFLNYLKENEDSNKWNILSNTPDNTIIPISTGYFFNNTNYKTEFGAISNATSIFAANLNIGADDPEIAIPILINEQKKAGCDEIIQIIQNDFDNWLKSKKK